MLSTEGRSLCFVDVHTDNPPQQTYGHPVVRIITFGYESASVARIHPDASERNLQVTGYFPR
jgi:hypothetical protein